MRKPSVTDQSESDVCGVDGRPLGPKGLKTRERLVNATEELLREVPYSEISTTDIARRAGLSAGTFYLYFKDALDAELAVISRTILYTPDVLATLEAPWRPDDAMERAAAFVRAYLNRWETNYQVLAVRTLLAAGGEERFVDAEFQSVFPLVEALAAKIAQHQADGIAPPHIDPMSAASCALGMLERIASYGKKADGKVEVDIDRVVEAAAHMIRSVVMG